MLDHTLFIFLSLFFRTFSRSLPKFRHNLFFFEKHLIHYSCAAKKKHNQISGRQQRRLGTFFSTLNWWNECCCASRYKLIVPSPQNCKSSFPSPRHAQRDEFFVLTSWQTPRAAWLCFLYSYFMRKCNGRLVFLPLFNFNLIVFARICFMFICAHTEQYKRLLFIQVPGLVCFCYFNFGIVSAHSKLGSESDCMGGWTSFGFSRPNEWVESLFFCVRKKTHERRIFV